MPSPDESFCGSASVLRQPCSCAIGRSLSQPVEDRCSSLRSLKNEGDFVHRLGWRAGLLGRIEWLHRVACLASGRNCFKTPHPSPKSPDFMQRVSLFFLGLSYLHSFLRAMKKKTYLIYSHCATPHGRMRAPTSTVSELSSSSYSSQSKTQRL